MPSPDNSPVSLNLEILNIKEDIIRGITTIFKELRKIKPETSKKLYKFKLDMVYVLSKKFPTRIPKNKETSIIFEDGSLSIIYRFSENITISVLSLKLWMTEYNNALTWSLLNIVSSDFLLNSDSPKFIFSRKISS